jgi:NDP-sugar pyrophosphorylase family protein
MGTRLMPLTASTPKALVTVNGITLLEWVIRKLIRENFTEIMVNVHHHAGQVMEFIANKRFQGADISISDESTQLLDTGGAIRKARWFLDGNEPFLVHNVDVISDIKLSAFLDEHQKKGGLATLSVIDRATRRYFLFDDTLQLCGWTDVSTGETRWAIQPELTVKKLAFSGIHIISPYIFRFMEESGRFSIIDTYLDLARTQSIYGFLQPGLTWFDLGKPDQIAAVTDYLKDHPEMNTWQ